jgi:hypothetical protein
MSVSEGGPVDNGICQVSSSRLRVAAGRGRCEGRVRVYPRTDRERVEGTKVRELARYGRLCPG